ncbi:MAG: hypothetical protein ABI696_09235 [Rubrivivax sp.]
MNPLETSAGKTLVGATPAAAARALLEARRGDAGVARRPGGASGLLDAIEAVLGGAERG